MTEQKQAQLEEKEVFNLEERIQQAATGLLNDGTVEKMVRNKVEKGFDEALDNLFRSYGDGTKIIEKQLKSVLVPFLEGYDYSEYVIKLDHVVTNILKQTSTENKTLLENFEELMSEQEKIKTITVTDLFEKWIKCVEKDIDTDDLEVCYDDGEPTYYSPEVTLEVVEDESRSWSSYKYATIVLECDKDEKMNAEVRLINWSHEGRWTIDYEKNPRLTTLRYLSKFEIFIMKLHQMGTKINIDTYSETVDDLEIEAKPEATFE
jgi:hypothetical protein